MGLFDDGLYERLDAAIKSMQGHETVDTCLRQILREDSVMRYIDLTGPIEVYGSSSVANWDADSCRIGIENGQWYCRFMKLPNLEPTIPFIAAKLVEKGFTAEKVKLAVQNGLERRLAHYEHKKE